MSVARSRLAVQTFKTTVRRWWSLFGSSLQMLLVCQQRSSDRRRLLAMSQRQLMDMGLSRADILREASKPFWRP